MAIKQRVLEKLKIIEDNLLYAMKTGNIKTIKAVGQEMEMASRICHEGLVEANYAPYKEIYDGMKLAIAEMVKDGRNSLNEETMLLCQELLQYLTKETENETSFKKEVVFLPYQAAMWDSLESVWKAAYEDKDHCNAYVIPIPYCERNPDTSAAVWHCDREKFPKYVPTMDWQRIDLKAWHPDVIFFHNPFDDHNAVTSVDSAYYSRNLRNCTDKLVYIPYAVEEEIQPGNEAAETAIEHRVLLPGFINAHLIIAQSEDMRQAWINILMRRTNVKDRAYWEKHILGLGSPKIDKVLTSKREDFKMPEKWMKLIKGKKVILYITSISPTLQYSDKVCDKLRYVFDIFKNRDDVVLWWRPHPLMKATFHSMRPQYEEEYLSIEKQYIEEGWGIYDDSSDLHRAICYSDAYYGDASSVMTMYEKTGKPVILEKIQSPEKAFPISYGSVLHAHNGLVEGNDFYFTLINCGGLFSFHMDTQIIERIMWFDGKLTRYWQYGNLVKDENRLFFVPTGKKGLILDLHSGRKEQYAVCFDYVKEGGVQFIDAHHVDDTIWLVPHHGRAVASYNLLNRSMEFYPEIFSLIKNFHAGVVPIFGGSIHARNSIWILSAQGAQIFRFDIDSRKTFSYTIKNKEKIGYIDYDGTDFWLYDLKGTLICWSPEYGEKSRYENLLELDSDYGAIKYVNGKIWLVANYQDVYGVFDIQKKKIEIYRGQLNLLNGKLGIARLFAKDKKLYIFPYEGNLFIRINTVNMKVDSWKIQFTEEIRSDYENECKKRFDSKWMEWSETAIFSVLDKTYSESGQGYSVGSGEKIYRRLMSQCH